MHMGEKIRRRREQLGWTQKELAEHIGMSQARISEVEAGERQQMSFKNLRAMARALGVSADYIIGTWDDLDDDTPRVHRKSAPAAR